MAQPKTRSARTSGRRRFLAAGGALASLAAFADLAGAQSGAQGPVGDLERKNIEVVNAMCATWKQGDPLALAAFVTEDFKFRGSAERLEAPPTANRQAFVDAIKGFFSTATVEMVIHDTFARGSVVVNIHQQLFQVKNQGAREDWYIGVFHLVDGKIREWNDYAIIPFSAPREPRPTGFGTFVHRS